MENGNKIAGIIGTILILGAVGYYGYTQGWFKWIPSGVDDDFSGDLSKWSIKSGTWEIQNDELYGYAPDYTRVNIIWDTDVGTDYTIEFDVRVTETRSTTSGGIACPEGQGCWRWTTEENFYYGGIGCYGGKAGIGRASTGSWAQIGISGSCSELSLNTKYHTKITVSSSTFKVYIDGTEVCSATDIYNAAGKVGFSIFASTVYFDNFKVS